MPMLFVYGTLLKHESNSHLLVGAACIDSSCFIYGELYDTSLGYSAVCVDETSHTVWGELYEVTNEILLKIDALEGYIGDELKNDYNRVELNVYRKVGVSQALVYVFPAMKTAHLSLIKSGRWRERV